MKTKNSFRALATIAASLMLIVIFAFSARIVKADPPEIPYRLSKVIVNGSSREIYTYDDCRFLTELLKQKKVSGVWVDLQLKSYTYDKDGNMLTELIQQKSGDAWTDSKLTTNAYDDHGHLLTSLIKFLGSGDYAELFTYTYDVNGNLEMMIKEYYSGGWDFDTRIMYNYDVNNNLIEAVEAMWDGFWYDYQFETWTYDENGNVLVHELMYPDYDYGERSTHISYDEDGNCLESFTEMYEGEWMNESHQTRKFEEGRLVYHLVEDWRGGVINDWVAGSQYLYEYNEDGILILYYNQIWKWIYPDFQDGWWKNNEKVEYASVPGIITGTGYRGDASGVWYPASVYMEFVFYDNTEKYVLYNTMCKTAELSYITPLSAEASPYQTVYYGYPPAACATVSVIASGGVEPYTYLWDNEVTTASFIACPTETTTYSVTVTDANGCTAEASTKVCVIDVRCGNNMNKVLVCHYPRGNPGNPQTLCVAQAAVPALLAHGDLLGPCGTDPDCTDNKSAQAHFTVTEAEDDPFIKAYPNPANQSTIISYRVNSPDQVTIRLVNSMGQPVMTLFEGYSPEGVIQELEAGLDNLQPGVYLLILQQADGTITTEKLLRQR